MGILNGLDSGWIYDTVRDNSVNQGLGSLVSRNAAFSVALDSSFYNVRFRCARFTCIMCVVTQRVARAS